MTFTACNKGREKERQPGNISREQLAEINRQLIIKDRERIINYIERKELDMKETGTGLWLSVIKKGRGNISEGTRVKLDYTCRLLDGTLVYDSDKNGVMSFEVGRSDAPAGLNEGVKLLGEGSEAIFIIPAYLAYGLLGDNNKIPPRAILVYELKVISVN